MTRLVLSSTSDSSRRQTSPNRFELLRVSAVTDISSLLCKVSGQMLPAMASLSPVYRVRADCEWLLLLPVVQERFLSSSHHRHDTTSSGE